MPNAVAVTDHLRLRLAQRNLSEEDMDFVLAYGRWVRRAGACHVFLGRRDLAPYRELARRFARLEGTTLLLEYQEDLVTGITIFRNRRGLKEIRKKTRYNRQRSRVARVPLQRGCWAPFSTPSS